MKIGIYVPVPYVAINIEQLAESVSNAQSSLPDNDVDAGYTLAKDIVTRADELGFDLALFAERMLGPDLEAWLLAAAIGSATERIKILTAVHPGLWHPSVVAKMSASLDRICKGRMAINLVTGWWEEEHLMFGGHPLEGDDRYLLAEEFTKVVRGYLEETEFQFIGKHYNIAPTSFPIRPGGTSTPEIFTASRSDRGLDMVAEVGDWWFVDYKLSDDFNEVLESARSSIELMRERCAKTGRRVKFAMNGFACIAETNDLAKEKAAHIIEQDQHGDPRFAFVRKGFLKAGFVGSYELIAERIQQLSEIGVELCLFQFYPTLSELALIGQELLPRIRTR